MGLEKGYMVIFDEAVERNPLLGSKGDRFEIAVDGKTLRIYLLGVSVEE